MKGPEQDIVPGRREARPAADQAPHGVPDPFEPGLRSEQTLRQEISLDRGPPQVVAGPAED